MERIEHLAKTLNDLNDRIDAGEITAEEYASDIRACFTSMEELGGELTELGI